MQNQPALTVTALDHSSLELFGRTQPLVAASAPSAAAALAQPPASKSSYKQKLANLGKRVGFVTSATAFCYWLILSPVVAMSFYNQILFRPAPASWQGDLSKLAYPAQDVFIKSTNGAVIHGLYVVNPHATKTILLSHGNGANVSYMSGYINLLLDSGASVFAYDYRGYGRSTGEPTLEGVVDDAVAAYDFLLQQGVQAKNIVAAGLSLGTGVSCQLAQRREVSGMILMAAYTDLMRVGRERLAWLRLYPDPSFPSQMLDSRTALSKVHPKTLIIHGAKDTLISIQHALDLKKHAVGELDLMVVPDGDHNNLLHVATPAMLERIRQFI
jgi:pimeloyl-ACP methyl ester carboxylesterase